MGHPSVYSVLGIDALHVEPCVAGEMIYRPIHDRNLLRRTLLFDNLGIDECPSVPVMLDNNLPGVMLSSLCHQRLVNMYSVGALVLAHPWVSHWCTRIRKIDALHVDHALPEK